MLLLKRILILAILFSATQSFADKMDLNTHTVVIDRLREIIKSLDNGDVSKVPSTLRLADLLAERSRLKSLSEVEKNCTNCLKSKEDRVEAIKHYQNILPQLMSDTRGHAMLQKAHLHLSLGQVEQAEKLQKQITSEGSKKHPLNILGQAHAALGDIYFQKAEFKKAKSEYDKALNIAETPQKGLVHYRLAWCLFNLDQVNKAIAKLEMILQNPQFTENLSSDGTVTQDESFKIDVSKDLASFYARTTITEQTLQKLTQLSPVNFQKENIHYLALEADRVGKKKEAALVWMHYLQLSEKDKDALEAQVRIMKLKRETGDLDGSIRLFVEVKNIWKKHGCSDQCEKLQGEIRRWIIDWNREEKKTLSTQITQAYLIFTDLFPEDEEMLLLGATSAHQRKQYKLAFDFFHDAAELSARKKNFKNLDNALLGEMDMAETMKNSELRMAAYHHYLQLNEKGEHAFEVHFQIAKLYFEIKDYEKASLAFKKVATMNAKREFRKEQIEAAHLALNSLIKKNNDLVIEEWSLEFAQRFSEEKNEFYKIHRKSVINTVSKKINEKTANSADLNKLKSVSLVNATPQEIKSLYKNLYLLSLQLKNYKDALHANLNTLALKDLSREENSQAVQDRIWLAEMALDYKEAYQLTKSQAGSLNEARALKLIWLAGMAGQDPDKHEKEFLKISHNKNLRADVIAHRIQRQAFPLKTLKDHMSELSQSPNTLAKLALEIYAKTRNREVLEKTFTFKSVRTSSFAGLISRLLSTPLLQKDILALTSSRLNNSNPQKLKKSLEDRLKKLASFETLLKQSVQSHDLHFQAVFLNVLKYEYARLHKDVLSLPLPRGLKKEELEQYKGLIAQQAAPYAAKSEKIEEKLQALWKQSDWIDTLAEQYRSARIEYKPALKEDLLHLIKHAPPSKAQYLQSVLNEKVDYPQQKTVLAAQSNVRQNPFEEKAVAQLKDIEQKRGNDLVVAHLEARLTQMKGMFR